jgi:hypothetical protein
MRGYPEYGPKEKPARKELDLILAALKWLVTPIEPQKQKRKK